MHINGKLNVPYIVQIHSERMTIVEGRINAVIDGEKRILTAGEEIVIKPYTVHGFKGFEGERFVLRERADPAGNYKAM